MLGVHQPGYFSCICITFRVSTAAAAGEQTLISNLEAPSSDRFDEISVTDKEIHSYTNGEELERELCNY